VPYFGYARHDRRSAPGAAVAVRVVGDVLRAAGVDRFVTVDPHIATLEAVVGAPLERVSAVQPLAQTLRSLTGPDAVIVAPDLGAVKLARRFGRELELDTAFVDKRRLSGSEVRASAVIGDVRGRRPVIVDDMISTGGTVIEAARALRDAGASGDLIVAATHGLFAAPAGERFEHLAPAAVITTDTVEQPLGLVPRSDKVSVVGLLTDAVRALHEHRALDGVAVFD
jgi:ribose-phosphate pyrophosphokinase